MQEVVSNVKSYLKKNHQKLLLHTPELFNTNYLPKFDTSAELSPSEASCYQSFISILRWIVDLGIVDITCEVSMMV